jgi:membrane protein
MRIYRILRGFARQMSRVNVNAYASSTAFFIFLSLIPMIMLICSILSFTPLLQESDLLAAVGLLPPSISPFLFSLVQSIYDSTFGMVSVTAIVTVWSAGKGVLALMRGLNAMNGVVEDRNYVLQRLIASFYLIIFLVTVVFSLTVMVFGNLLAGVVIRHAPGMEALFELLLHLRGIFSWCIMTMIFAAMYTYIPNCKLKFSHQIPGAVFSATSWNLFSWGFSIYVQHFNAFDMYGSLTTIVILMLWLYFCFYLFLIGAHINRFLEPFRRMRERTKKR